MKYLKKAVAMRVFGWVLGGLFLAGVLAFGWVMFGKTTPYFSFERAINFLGTKQDFVLDNPVFRAAFYTHIVSALVVLVVGAFQFFHFSEKKAPFASFFGQNLHFGDPFPRGPIGDGLGKICERRPHIARRFSLQCIVWVALTAAAWWEIRHRRWLDHTHFMLRSYAVTLAAMSLRTESYWMYYSLGTKPIETYQTVTWLSWVGNLLIVECLIYFGLGRLLLANARS